MHVDKNKDSSSVADTDDATLADPEVAKQGDSTAVDATDNFNAIVDQNNDADGSAKHVDLGEPAADDDITDNIVKPPSPAIHTANDLNSNVNNNNAATNIKLTATTSATTPPLTSPRRKIKPRREDGFVYAQDTKPKGPTTNTQPKKSANTTEAESAHPKKPRKRPHKCPSKDSIFVEIPLSATVDLGVAMKRTRRKRSTRIKRWVASGLKKSGGGEGAVGNTAGAAPGAAGAASEVNGAPAPGDDQLKENDKKEAPTEDRMVVHDPNNDEMDQCSDYDDDDAPLNRTQYASIVDYLEAKYVRGVMIEDYDERERQKKKKKRKNPTDSENNEGKEEASHNESHDEGSDGKGSIYESDDGWIDDTLLHEEVAGQVLASSAYGLTQIEEEAKSRRRKRGRVDQMKTGDNVEDNETDMPEMGEDGTKKDKEEAGNKQDKDKEEDSGAEDNALSDFDDGFFVNLGDLEMAKGWNGEIENHDIASPEKKGAKKKRAYIKKPKDEQKSKKSTKDEQKSVKKKSIKVKSAVGDISAAAKKKLLKKAKQKDKEEKKKERAATKKKKSEGDRKKIVCKKKKAEDNGKKKLATKKKVMTEGEGKARKSTNKEKKNKVAVMSDVENDDSTDTDESKASSTTAAEQKPNKKKVESERTNKKKSPTPVDTTDKPSKKDPKPAKSAPPPPPMSEKKKPQPSKEKEHATTLRKLYKRRYNACIKQMNELTSEELPRKPRNKSNTMKVSVNIPMDKEIGDEITFG